MNDSDSGIGLHTFALLDGRYRYLSTVNESYSVSTQVCSGGMLEDGFSGEIYNGPRFYGVRMPLGGTMHSEWGVNPTCYGYGASRRMSNKALSESQSEDTCTSLFRDNADLLNAEEWLVLADYATKTGTRTQKQRAKRRLERIKSLLIDILPDVTEFRFGTTADNAMTPRVEAKTPYDWVRVADLSLGYKTALTWIVDLASRLFERYPDSDNPLTEPAVVLVDEIDLHLHPRWQRELLPLLSDTFPHTQFIVTAHSPLIVQAAPEANLALLRREGDHVVIDNDVDHIRRWRVDQILASELFGEQPTHAREVEELLDERTRLAQKTRLTARERERLAQLEAEIDRLPTAAAPEDRQAMDIIRRAAALLEKEL
jgi:hypothetical protein